MTHEDHVPTEPGRTPGTATTDSSGARPAWTPTSSASDGQLRRDRTRRKHSNRPLLLAAAAAVVLLGLLVWLVISLLGEADHDDLVDPSSISAGECLADFTAITEDAAVVDCSEPHNAQLLASESYPEDAAFPGRDQLSARAEASCAAASGSVDPDAVTEDLEITLLRATPTEGTWADGDRRVDCFAVIENGATVTRSLIAP